MIQTESTQYSHKSPRMGRAQRECLLKMYEVGHPTGARKIIELTGRDPNGSGRLQTIVFSALSERGLIASVPDERNSKWRKWYLTAEGLRLVETRLISSATED